MFGLSAYDRWLTTPPSDGYDNWHEDLVGHQMSDAFFEANEDWVLDQSHDSQCNKWLNKLFYKMAKSPKEAAAILERAHSIYIRK